MGLLSNLLCGGRFDSEYEKQSLLSPHYFYSTDAIR